MTSKAKSGLSAARQFGEDWIVPPIVFTGGATSYVSSTRDGKGHAALHVGVTNNTAFTLTILHSWQATGTFVQAKTVASAADPVTGNHVVDITMPIFRRFVKISIAVPGGLGALFEVGAFFLPRASSSGTSGSGGASGGLAVANRPGVTTGQKNVAAAGTGVVLSADQAVPDGFSVFITFKKANSGTNIYLSDTKAHAEDHTGAKILNTQNSGVRLYVTNLSQIWIDADTSSDGVDWIVEK